MASQNVVFAIDLDYRPKKNSDTTYSYEKHVKRWMLRILLSLGHKQGLEKVRWGHKFFHSRTVKSASLISRGSDFKELQEKAFSDFEEELLVKLSVEEKSPRLRAKLHKPSPACCVQNAIKEILLDFQWDRPDLTSPTKVTLRTRRSSRTGKTVPPQDYDSTSVQNLLFVVSECPQTKSELEGFLSLCGDDRQHHRSLQEQLLPKGVIDMLIQRKVILHWSDLGVLKGNHNGQESTGVETLKELLSQVGGRVVPMLSPCLAVSDPNFSVNHCLALGMDIFPIEATNNYLKSSGGMLCKVFSPLNASLCWTSDGSRRSLGVMLEPVSCMQRCLYAPVEVTLRGFLQDLDHISISRVPCESWILRLSLSSDLEKGPLCFRELFLSGRYMIADVSEGGVTCSAVLSMVSSCTALLTVLQPLVTLENELVTDDMVSSDTSNISSDLPDVVTSVLNVVYDIMENTECLDHGTLPLIPDWVSQELKQGARSQTNSLVEGWFALSDQAGVSSHLMESFRLLHAAPEEEEQADVHQEITSSLSELYQSITAGSSGNLRSNKRGTQRTPVRQKMKTMSRSLQMLNFARLNVKAQKTHADGGTAGSAKGDDKGNRKCTGERSKPGPKQFSNEEELVSYLVLNYQRVVEDTSVSVSSQVPDLLSVVKGFVKSNDIVYTDLVQNHLLKTCKSIQQLCGNSSNVENKIRESQLQAVLRLELFLQSDQEDDAVVEQRVEDIADMLRIISRSKDASFLSKFMQDEVLPVYLNSIPKALADVYYSLGTCLPDALVAVLPSDFFSDESLAKDSVSVSSPFSATRSNVSSVGDHLEELRNRSAKKRRHSFATRHKSMTEAPQALRQIEVPRKSTRLTKTRLSFPDEKPATTEALPQKQPAQEVTKVRRNLFNQMGTSPSKKSKMPRSQSVSAVEGLRKRKRLDAEDDERHALLTKKVSETPQHKQVSNRLLHRQKTGRRSGETAVCIIEESPLKPTSDLRRSPRIKSLTRRHSSVFYSSSQPRSRNLERVLSSSQVCNPDAKDEFNMTAVRSPVRLLFGATQSPGRLRHNAASSSEGQNKTPQKSESTTQSTNSRAPRAPNRKVGDTGGMVLRGTPVRSPHPKSLEVQTPTKSPLKGILKTPMKDLHCAPLTGAWMRSPNVKTPKKSVTWSPSPQRLLRPVPVSPVFTEMKSPTKVCSLDDKISVFKTPDKVSQPTRTTRSRLAGNFEINKSPDSKLVNTRSGKMERTQSLPGTLKGGSVEEDLLLCCEPSFVCLSPLKLKTHVLEKNPEPMHQMCTRSGRTPVKDMSSPSKWSQASENTSFLPNNVKDVYASSSNVGDCPQVFESRCQQPSLPIHKKTEDTFSSDSQQFDCSEFSTTTDEESIDISEASVVKTELTGGIKMNIAFSKKPSRVFKFEGEEATPATPTRTYGFRQTPDRRQREAEARLGNPSGTPCFSTPRVRKTPACTKSNHPLTYEVELEMQASGLPKLRLRRTDSFNAGEAPNSSRKSFSSNLAHPMSSNKRALQSDSPLAQCSRHRDSPSISPSLCSRGTPGKGTPGKGLQTYICQSITPTRCPTATSPQASGELTPLTPSPQSMGRSTPENLNSWPRKKKARLETRGCKEKFIKGVTLLERSRILDDPELEGVFCNQDVEEHGESFATPISKTKTGLGSTLVVDQNSPEDMDWAESEVPECDSRNASKSEHCIRMGKKVDTPKVNKPLSASGIFALTQSPLLYKKATKLNESPQYEGTKTDPNVSPLFQQSQKRTFSRTYSRKKLLD